MKDLVQEYSTTYSIQHLPECDRPRERLLKHGPEAMTTPELLAIILGSGMRGVPVLQLAQQILVKFGTLENLVGASVEELCKIKGLGIAKALQLKAAFSLGLRVSKKIPTARYRIEHPDHAYNLIKDELQNEKKELFVVILLDTRSCLINHHVISVGTLTRSLVHAREVFNPAIRHHAASIVVAHNHPSGDPTPSQSDFAITTSLIKAGKIIGIHVNDHLIIGSQGYISLRDKGLEF